MNINPVILSIPIYFLLIGIELLIQQFSKKKLYRLNDAVTNISCGITQQLTGIFFKIFNIGIYQLVYENFALFHIPSNWITLVILFIAVDFFYYWGHRKSHEINLFWGGHVVHHQSEEYNLSVALRQSTFQVIWTFAFYMPLAIIGFNTLDFALMAALTTVYQFWIHTETIKKLGVLEYVFNTPSHHRVHHGRDPKYIDRNHAGVFIVWDKMFGTFQVEEEKPTYGITKPINSWNPVWVNLHHYAAMASTFSKIKSFKNKILFLFKKPGWLPEEMGGYQRPEHVDKNAFRKFDTVSPSIANYYVLFQYLITLLGTSFFLFNQESFSLVQKALIVTGIIWTVMNCGGLIESKNWVTSLEILRLIVICSILFMVTDYQEFKFAIILYISISLLWTFKILKFKVQINHET